MGQAVSRGNLIHGLVTSHGNPAGIGVLDNRHSWVNKVIGCANGCIGINIVVIRHLFATEQGGLSNTVTTLF